MTAPKTPAVLAAFLALPALTPRQVGVVRGVPAARRVAVVPVLALARALAALTAAVRAAPTAAHRRPLHPVRF